MANSLQTVLGPIPIEAMGVTLMHEHLLCDVSNWHHPPVTPERLYLRDAPVTPSIYGELRMDPFVNRPNLRLDDVAVAAEEAGQFATLGGQTILDPTCRGIARDPVGLAAIARQTGLHIVMGCGYYLESSHPPHVADMTVEAIAAEIVADLTVGVGEPPIRAGFIGEIGVSAAFTLAEQKVLRGAAQAQVTTGHPLMVHLPGWERHGHRVLDIAAAEGVDPHRVILCHMNPSWHDTDYQTGLAERGAALEYDMIGMDYFYADQGVQCPSDEENAAAIAALIAAGHGDSLLLSHDVFLKMMLTRYGGFGYGYLLRHFVPRLLRHGVSPAWIDRLLIDTPRRLFSTNPAAAS